MTTIIPVRPDWLTDDDLDALDQAADLLPPTMTGARWRVERSLDEYERRHSPWLVLDPSGDVVSKWSTWHVAYWVAVALARAGAER